MTAYLRSIPGNLRMLSLVRQQKRAADWWQKNGKDLYHIVWKFLSDSNDARTSETNVRFDGKRQVLFEDQAQCIVI